VPENASSLLISQYKAYHSLEETQENIQALLKQVPANTSVYASVPLSFIEPLIKHFAGQNVLIGAEYMLSLDEKTFTGSISIRLLKESGAQFVLIGSDSERKSNFPETSQIKQKILEAISAGIKPILCLTGSEEEINTDQSKSVFMEQLKEATENLTQEQLVEIYLMYDASWINQAPWEASSQTLQKAYQSFNAALLEVFPNEINTPLKVIYAVPPYSSDLPQIMSSLPAIGYSLGMFDARQASLFKA